MQRSEFLPAGNRDAYPESPERTDHRKYRFGFSACMRTVFESPPPSQKPYRRYRVLCRHRQTRIVFRHRAPSRVAVPSPRDFPFQGHRLQVQDEPFRKERPCRTFYSFCSFCCTDCGFII
ncbi:hypothetical protein Zmor_024063 [Zophobas morio]|uniref:Uncharacterized protein n=1 Tax=Zophobas morio TaxID=2755281 RepID=A0AA38M7Q1_9CUCU|nr:hypothetical protein Zmor_024063 [Zophobas morio]